MVVDLLEAYRKTSFLADTPVGRLRIRVGERCADLDRLLVEAGVRAWTYVTAYNPGSIELSEKVNRERQAQLESEIARAGYTAFAGEGVADDGGWRPEPSLLVLGISREHALRLGQEFGQLAVVYGEFKRPAELLVSHRRP